MMHDMAPHNLRVGLKLCAYILHLVMVRWKRQTPLPFSSNEEVRLGLGRGWVECSAAVAGVTIEMS